MPGIVIYTKSSCRFCDKAKQLFVSKQVSFVEKDVTHDVLLKREMIERSGGRITTPQIFISGKHIGGCDDLFNMDKEGELDLTG